MARYESPIRTGRYGPVELIFRPDNTYQVLVERLASNDPVAPDMFVLGEGEIYMAAPPIDSRILLYEPTSPDTYLSQPLPASDGRVRYDIGEDRQFDVKKGEIINHDIFTLRHHPLKKRKQK